MNRRQLLVPLIFFTLTGCVGFFGQDRAIKVYPRPAKVTLVAVNQALRDLNFFPTDMVPSHSNPLPTYVTSAYKEQSLGEIVYIAVRDLGGERSQVEVLTQGDVTGVWTWTVWWPSLIFEQTDRRLRTAALPQPGPVPSSPPSSSPSTY
ncbi:MAG: hypothetical protein HY278_01035 [candidate division NC10 bacterium]|nr:hypothetical protein [candidate division NC10 bacterium]